MLSQQAVKKDSVLDRGEYLVAAADQFSCRLVLSIHVIEKQAATMIARLKVGEDLHLSLWGKYSVSFINHSNRRV